MPINFNQKRVLLCPLPFEADREENHINQVPENFTLSYWPMLGSVQAGFPSPAADYMEEGINLNRDLIRHPHATYFMRAKGESMTGAYIPPEAILVIDRLEKPKNGSIVVAVVNGEFTVKRLSLQQSKKHLLPENPKYAPIEINEFTQCELWGVVIHIIIDAKTV